MKDAHKHSHAGEYQCLHCGVLFRVDGAKLECPSCSNHKVDELIPVYIEDDAEEEEHTETGSPAEE